MIDITKKRLPSFLIGILVYLSYCAANWYITRGTIGYYGYQYGLPAWITSDIVAFLLGGIVPIVLYMVITHVRVRMLSFRVGVGANTVKYGLDLTVIAANVLLFLIKLIFLAAPLYAVPIIIIIDPLITLAAVSLYLFYAFKMEYVEKTKFRTVVNYVLGAFIVVYGILTALDLILTVM